MKRWPVLLLITVTLTASAAPASLVDAVKNGDAGAIRALLQRRVDVNVGEPDGTTALHWAARNDDIESAGLLIRAGANARSVNRYGVTPLYLACINGSAPMIETLVKAGADPNAVSIEGETALMTAARTGKTDAVRVLLALKADVNAKESRRGQTALMWAAAEGHADTLRVLIEHGADLRVRSNGGFTALLFAVREGRIPAVQTLLEKGAAVDESLQVRQQPGPNAFMLGVENAHWELAAFLLDKGADPNAAPQGWTALHQVTWVRKAGLGDNQPAPPGSGNMTSLEFVRKLAAHGSNVNARVSRRPGMGSTTLNPIGATPLLLAARTHDADLMRLLVQLGADPSLSNEDGSTVLLVAAGVGTSSADEDPGTEPEVLDSLKVALEFGGDINAVDKNGDTVMHGAAFKHAPSVVRFLAEHGAKTEIWNQPNKRGFTPLRIVEGIKIGMNIVSHAPTAAAIREVLQVR